MACRARLITEGVRTFVHDRRRGARSSRHSKAEGLTIVIRIAITQAAFKAIAKTLPLGSVGYENATNEKG